MYLSKLAFVRSALSRHHFATTLVHSVRPMSWKHWPKRLNSNGPLSFCKSNSWVKIFDLKLGSVYAKKYSIQIKPGWARHFRQSPWFLSQRRPWLDRVVSDPLWLVCLACHRAVGQRSYLRCGALDARVQKERVIWVSDNWKIMRLSGLEMKYHGVWFEIVIRTQEQFQGQE